MNELSKKLSSLLRHTADFEGLSVSAAGWVPVYQVLEYMDIRSSELRKLIAQNTKGCLEIRGSMIRSSHGHSTKLPVLVESLEASWAPYASSEPLWYGTSLDYLQIVSKLGIKPVKRTHVQLTLNKENVFWRRQRIAVLLEISSKKIKDSNLNMFRVSNDAILTRFVPENCVVKAYLRDEKNLVVSASKFVPPKWR